MPGDIHMSKRPRIVYLSTSHRDGKAAPCKQQSAVLCTPTAFLKADHCLRRACTLALTVLSATLCIYISQTLTCSAL